MKCPECHSENLDIKILYVVSIGKPTKNSNYTKCLVCGLVGKAYQFGAEDIKPLAGTEGWSEEKVEKFFPYLQKRLEENFPVFTHIEEING